MSGLIDPMYPAHSVEQAHPLEQLGQGYQGGQGDQADGLRRLFGPRVAQRVCFISGRESRGRSVLVAHTAAALAAWGHGVMIVDENSAPDNAARAFGLAGHHDLLDAVQGRHSVRQVELAAAPLVRLTPAARAARVLQDDAIRQTARWHQVTGEMEAGAAFVLVDASQRNGAALSVLARAAPHWVIVVAAQGAAITQAYELLKNIARTHGRQRFLVAITRARSSDEARAIFDNMSRVAASELGVQLKLLGVAMSPVTEHLADALLTRLPPPEVIRVQESGIRNQESGRPVAPAEAVLFNHARSPSPDGAVLERVL